MAIREFYIVGVLSLGLLTGTAHLVSAEGVTLKQVAEATTASEFVDLGGKKLSAAQFKKKVVGRPMMEIGGGWDWTINADGTAVSGGDVSQWKMDGNRYCRGFEAGEVNCGEAVMIGNYLRMTKGGGDELAGWTVKVE